MSSVLTILSKSTASTQYPDVNDVSDINKKPKPRRHKSLKSNENAKNYKSRVLNQQTVEDDFIILQSKKDIDPSSSNYSGSIALGRSDVQRSKEENSVLNQVLEGKKYAKEEPTTVVETGENDKKVYNLFVDLLETTLNMYNEDTECENSKALNTILEVNQDVAEKLEINPKYDVSHHSLVRKKFSDTGLYRDSGVNIVDRTIRTDYSHHVYPKIKSKSFVHVKKTLHLPKSKSFEPKTVNTAVKTKKKNLLNILKEQIQMGSAIEEPSNLYEALRIMAKNKQRSEKSIRFYQSQRFVGRKDHECTFKRRNLFTKSKKRRKTDKVINEKRSKFDRIKIKQDTPNKIKPIPSYRSVEVYGYNYEERDEREIALNEIRKMREEIEKRRVMFTYHPPSPLISDLDYYALLKYPDTSASFCGIQKIENYDG